MKIKYQRDKIENKIYIVAVRIDVSGDGCTVAKRMSDKGVDRIELVIVTYILEI